VKSNQIAVKNAQKQFLSDGQNSVDLTTRERGVQEEANFDILLGCANFLSQHLWQKHEMIIVDPDQIPILNILCHGLRKLSIDLYICIPSRLIESDLSRVVMEEGP
jgi:hypothetical protein